MGFLSERGPLACLLLLLPGWATPGSCDDIVDLASCPGVDADRFRNVVFHAVDLASGEAWAWQPEQLDERHAPWSTFKIPNVLIARESGLVDAPDRPRGWDPERRPAAPHWPPAWKGSHTLESAFRHSVVWYFQDIALEVGGESYRRWLKRLDYGNAAVPDGSDTFWLGGPLAISPREQTRFLSRLLNGELPVGGDSIASLRRASLSSSGEGWAVHGKTGAGRTTASAGGFEGWWVGWVDRDGTRPVVFALFTTGRDYDTIRTFRQEGAEILLTCAGVLPIPPAPAPSSPQG